MVIMIIILNTNVGYLYANGGKENYSLSFRTKHGFTWGDGGHPPPLPQGLLIQNSHALRLVKVQKKQSKLALDSIFLSNIFVCSCQPKKQRVILSTSWSTEYPLVSKMTNKQFFDQQNKLNFAKMTKNTQLLNSSNKFMSVGHV